jgi:hypothetical protein
MVKVELGTDAITNRLDRYGCGYALARRYGKDRMYAFGWELEFFLSMGQYSSLGYSFDTFQNTTL